MSNSKIDLSIVIPAYNEEFRIRPTLESVDDFLATSSLSYEIVVVDDGSSDNTAKVVSWISAERPNVRLLGTSPNRGKGHAVRLGMLNSEGEVRMMFDADGSMPAREIPKLYNVVATGEAELALGSRYANETVSDQPQWRMAWSRLCNWFIRRTVVAGVADTQCGFKAFTSSAATDLFSKATIDGWAFDLEVLALAERIGYSMSELSVVWVDDDDSKVSPLKDFVGVVREWLAIRRNLRKGAYGLLKATA